MKNCLLVDDSRIVRKVAGNIVRELGFRALEAESGEEAYEHCKQDMPDAILLDMKMPGISGFEFLERFYELEKTKDAKIIICTAERSVPHIQKALQAGAHEYIIKPFDREIIRFKFIQTGLIK